MGGVSERSLKKVHNLTYVSFFSSISRFLSTILRLRVPKEKLLHLFRLGYPLSVFHQDPDSSGPTCYCRFPYPSLSKVLLCTTYKVSGCFYHFSLDPRSLIPFILSLLVLAFHRQTSVGGSGPRTDCLSSHGTLVDGSLIARPSSRQEGGT